MFNVITPSQAVIIMGLLLIFSELFIGVDAGMDLVAIGSTLIIGGFAGILTGNFTVTLVVSSVLAAAYIFYGRSVVKKKIIVLTHKTNIDKLIGKKGVVIRSITPDTAGMVRLDDEDWRATSDEVLYEKDSVTVTGIEGVGLVVTKTK